MKFIADIIEKGVREHPELSVGSNTEGIDVRSVGNSVVLKQTALIEVKSLCHTGMLRPYPPSLTPSLPAHSSQTLTPV